ncbi:MAG: arginine deiminase-related protein [Proteobacteria bacterium]|nr:arginine deiminase-related protein [Pseudomonadota bacterium]
MPADLPLRATAGQSTADAQTADAVLMVRPASFGWNPQTQASNRFQRAEPGRASDANERACAEFDALVLQLRGAGVDVTVAADTATPVCPDAIFPNNWVSLHADGTVVLYPMLARNRRLERRLELIASLAAERRRTVVRLLDLTQHESHDRFLEGTGSIVFDHARRIAYACLSPRTHPEPLAELCDELGYQPCTFMATDAAGVPIYHTNVMLAVGSRCCVVAASAIVPRDRERVLSSLAAADRHVEIIDATQMAGFAGNVLELRAADAGSVLAMSATAHASFGPAAIERLASTVNRIVAAPIPTIETLGGGSVRCMLAEVFLPH